MVHLSSAFVLTAALGACVASTPIPQPTGPLETTSISRTVFVRGLRVNGVTQVRPDVVRRSYVLSCGPTANGASIAARAPQAVAIIKQIEGSVSEGGIGASSARNFEMKRVNPTLVQRLNCAVSGITNQSLRR